MTVSTVAVTGGNGKIGRAVLQNLNQSGYETTNIARGKQRESVSDQYIETNLLDAGETYGALSKTDADAVIHLGTIPRPNGHQQYKTYNSNVMGAVHVLEASESLGLDSCCLASSVNAIGTHYQRRPPEINYLPVDEDHPRTPDDIYGIAKHAMEVTADGFGRRESSDLTISSLRYPWVLTEQEAVEELAEADRSMEVLYNGDPGMGRDVLFSYIHIDDAATVAQKAIEANYDGHEVFWAVADDTTAAVPSSDLVAEFFQNVRIRDEFEQCEALVDLSKANSMLGWTPQHSWRDYRESR
jgi:nucleoside-diphosphate-sugar epimerase